MSFWPVAQGWSAALSLPWLAARPDVDLVSLTRRGSSVTGHQVDFEQLCLAPASVLGPLAPAGIDVAISCLGTTIRAAGSEQAMFRVDHDYILGLASGARALGARQFILMTSVGAGGPGFYLKTKGAIEEAVGHLGFDRLDLIRPGELVGHRAEQRPLETIGQRVLAVLAPLMAGPFARYTAIPADTVADAILALIGQPETGRHVHENDGLRRDGTGNRSTSG
ncbi:hypothetical protein [Pleomorphomonas sp. PLEO]|uniref:hypothetical protein n=1 Tax=Pleomorphomonas sp. PLEO TaxID=3239306 RepID=UPI00351E51EA